MPAAVEPLRPLLDLPGVDPAATAAREAVDTLRRHRVLRRRSAEVSAESALHGARASAALEGADHPLAEVRRGEVTDPVVQGALRVSAALGGLVGTWRVAPLQVLARLHVLAASGQTDDVGRPVVGDSTRLSALAGLVVSGGGAPAVVLAAVVHGELLALAPFPVANGIVARAAGRLTGIAAGLDPHALSVPEVGHLVAGDYQAAAAAYSSGTSEGLTRWLLHCCTAVERGAQEGLAICEAVQRG